MSRKSSLYYLLISFVVILIDQISKILIVKNLGEGGAVSVIGDLLYFRFIYNEGGVMGTNLGPSWLYAILSLAALVLIVRYFISSKSDGVITRVSLALILGGAIGNLIDRLRYGKVVDFIDMDMPDIPFLHLYRWFTFNIADAAITIGLILFALKILLQKKTDDELPNLPDTKIPEVESDSSKA